MQAEAEFNSKEEAAEAEAKAIAYADAASDERIQRLNERKFHRKAMEALPLPKLEKEIHGMKMWLEEYKQRLEISGEVFDKRRAEEREVAELKEREEAIVAKKKVVDHKKAEAMAADEDLRRMMAELEEKKEELISKKRSRDWEGVE